MRTVEELAHKGHHKTLGTLILHSYQTPTMDNITQETREVFQKILTGIAQKNLGIETLETRKSDDLDFHDVAVWGLKRALEDAFIAGMTVRADFETGT